MTEIVKIDGKEAPDGNYHVRFEDRKGKCRTVTLNVRQQEGLLDKLAQLKAERWIKANPPKDANACANTPL